MNIQKIAAIVLLVVLIITMIIVYYMLYNSNSNVTFPPIIKKCPDSLKLNEGKCGSESSIKPYDDSDVCKFKEANIGNPGFTYNWDGITNAVCD